MTIIERMQNLILASNQTTAASDTNLTSAIRTLIEGYRQGSKTIFSNTWSGIITLSSEAEELVNIPHGLGEIPDLAIFIAHNADDPNPYSNIRTIFNVKINPVDYFNSSELTYYVDYNEDLGRFYRYRNMQIAAFSEDFTSTYISFRAARHQDIYDNYYKYLRGDYDAFVAKWRDFPLLPILPM